MAEADRRDARFEAKLSCDVESPTAGLMSAVTIDLSVGGAALETDQALPEGETVRLSLFLVVEGIEDERTPPLVVGAHVQWSGAGDDGTHTAGVRFVEITDPQKAWLSRVLAVVSG
jgi:c-di-GMP-binding flagellar brake protein YcgR